MRTTIGLLLLLLTLGFTPLSAQSKSRKVRSLEQRRTELLRKIDNTSRELNQVKRSSQTEKKRLDLVHRQVIQRKEVIAVIEQEMSALSQLIDSLGVEIVQKRARESHLLEQYGRSVRALQRGEADAASRILFLFSSNSFDEVVQRQKFLGSYAVATSAAAKHIKDIRQQIEATQAEVNRSHEQKSELLSLRNSERQKLEAEESKTRQQVASLEGTARKLSQDLTTQQRQARQLEQQIEKQIAAEIAAAEAKARREAEARERRRRERAERQRQAQSGAKPATPTRSEAGKTPSKETTTATPDDEERDDPADERRAAVSGGYAMNAEERKLSGSFSQNRGRLPMPIRGRYDLVRGFGLQQHSSHSRVQVSSSGIDLRTYTDRSAYAVFAGVVSQVFMTPGYGQSIIIRHGNYLTVFSNLANVRVSKGQRVSPGQALGTISTSGDTDRAGVLHFQIWHERNKLNPLQWLKR